MNLQACGAGLTVDEYPVHRPHTVKFCAGILPLILSARASAGPLERLLWLELRSLEDALSQMCQNGRW